MQSKATKLKLTCFVVAVFVSLVLLFDAVIFGVVRDQMVAISHASLAILKGVLIFLSVYALFAAWFFQARRTAILNRLRERRSLFAPEIAFLLPSYLLLACPAFFGLLLYYCGMPLREYLYFVGASLAMTVAWGIYDLWKA